MPARAPGERPKEGETVQEHDLEDRRERRDRQASDQRQQSPTKRETWEGWEPHSSAWLPRAQLIENLRESYGIEINADQIEHWEAQGYLPPPPRSGYPPSHGFLIRALIKAEHAGLGADTIQALARITADTLDQDDELDTQERLEEVVETEKARRQTWRDWMSKDTGLDPTDMVFEDDLITRDELLQRVQTMGLDIHPRTLQSMEMEGLVPRPIRHWHEGATRALYAPWVVDVVFLAQDLRRQRRQPDEIRNATRAEAEAAWFGYLMNRDSELRIPTDILDRLRALAYRHTRFHADVAAVEINFLDDDGNAFATQHHRYGDTS